MLPQAFSRRDAKGDMFRKSVLQSTQTYPPPGDTKVGFYIGNQKFSIFAVGNLRCPVIFCESLSGSVEFKVLTKNWGSIDSTSVLN